MDLSSTTRLAKSITSISRISAINENATSLVALGGDGRIVDLEKGTVVSTLEGVKIDDLRASFAPDGSKLIAAVGGAINIWDSATGKRLQPIEIAGDAIRYGTFASRGRNIVAVQDDAVTILDATTRSVIKRLSNAKSKFDRAVPSDDGLKIAVISRSADLLTVWDVSAEKIVGEFRREGIAAVNFASDGAILVATIAREVVGSVDVWDGSTGVRIATMTRHKGQVTAVAFGANGARMLTGSRDASARLWDVRTGRELLQLKGQKDGAYWTRDTPTMFDMEMGQSVYWVAFAKDGAHVVSNPRFSARIWKVRRALIPGADLAAELCAAASPGITMFTREEMRLVGHSDEIAAIDVCGKIDEIGP